MSDKISPVRHLQFSGYSPEEFVRLSETIKRDPFPGPVRVETDPEFYFRTEMQKFDDQFFTVEIDVLHDAFGDGCQTIEIQPGQLVVWFSGYAMVFDQNNPTKTMTQYRLAVNDIPPGAWL